MNTKVEAEESRFDTVKLGLVLLLLAGGIAAFYYFAEQSLLIRVGGLLVVVAASAAIAYTTDLGRRFWGLTQDSRNEVRKVVWPSRQETVQTTLLVMAMVIVVALILWALDAFLGWGVKQLIGRGG